MAKRELKEYGGSVLVSSNQTFMEKFIPKATANGVRGVGSTAAAYINHNVIPDMLKKSMEKNPNIIKVRGPLLFLGATAAQVFSDNEYVDNLLQGVASMGFTQSASDFMPMDEEKDEKMLDLGLKGLHGSLGQATETTRTLPAATNFDWASLAEEADIIELEDIEEVDDTDTPVSGAANVMDKF
jgi:hypothetical protein